MKIAGVGICTHASGAGLTRWRALADGALAALGGRRDVPILVGSCNGAADTLDADSWSRAFADLGALPVASAACASGLHALWLARAFLATHDEVIVLAVDIVSPASHANFAALRVLDDAPAPWQPTSAGFREGEAAVAIRLQRGSDVVGPLLGNDNLAELVRAISGDSGSDTGCGIGFVIGQGTGPAAVDGDELAALPPGVPLSTALVSCGHTIGASGLLSLALAHLLQLESAPSAAPSPSPSTSTSTSTSTLTSTSTSTSTSPSTSSSHSTSRLPVTAFVMSGHRTQVVQVVSDPHSRAFDFRRGFGHPGQRARDLLSLPFATALDGRPLGVPRELRGDILVACRALGGACAVARVGGDASDDVALPSRWVEPRPAPPLRIPLLREIAALPRPATLPAAIVVRMDAPLVPPDDARIGARLLPSVVLEITPGFVAQLLARVWGFAGPALTLVGGSAAGWVPTLAAIERVCAPVLVLCVHARDFEWGT